MKMSADLTGPRYQVRRNDSGDWTIRDTHLRDVILSSDGSWKGRQTLINLTKAMNSGDLIPVLNRRLR